MEKRGRDKFNRFKTLIRILVIMCSTLPLKLRIVLFEHFRMTQGKIGLAIRYIFLKTIAKSCGDNVSIHPNVYLFSMQNLSVGTNVSIHPMCYIDAAGSIVIGNDVSIAHGVTIMSSSHQYDNVDVPIKDQQIELKLTCISDNVWIGAKATILYGRNVGGGSIIAANCVVTQDVPDGVIVCGVPARILKKR
ncbi:MAG: acyltransferase [Clostridiales bacterium]|nr:acyltransferase [Clostridiales bacterium]